MLRGIFNKMKFETKWKSYLSSAPPSIVFSEGSQISLVFLLISLMLNCNTDGVDYCGKVAYSEYNSSKIHFNHHNTHMY
jgi:hypothetical protein